MLRQECKTRGAQYIQLRLCMFDNRIDKACKYYLNLSKIHLNSLSTSLDWQNCKLNKQLRLGMLCKNYWLNLNRSIHCIECRHYSHKQYSFDHRDNCRYHHYQVCPQQSIKYKQKNQLLSMNYNLEHYKLNKIQNQLIDKDNRSYCKNHQSCMINKELGT